MTFASTVLVILGVVLLSGVAVTVVFAMGMYFGWFRIGSGSKAPEDDFRFTLDEDMIKNDPRSAPLPEQDVPVQDLVDNRPGISDHKS
jgi:hypothetical protein